MTFWNIPATLLDQQLGEGYDTSWTLRSELERSNEDILYAEWELWDDGKLKWFLAWSATLVHVMVSSGFGDYVIYPVKRDPPIKTNSQEPHKPDEEG